MAHILALDQENHVTANIFRMTANSLQRTKPEHGFDYEENITEK